MHSHIAGDPACSYISLRLREKLKLYGGVDGSGRAFDSTVLKLALEELCAEAGVQLLYHTFISDVLVENGVVKAVVAGNKSGTVVIAGDMFIDCTRRRRRLGARGRAVRQGQPRNRQEPADLAALRRRRRGHPGAGRILQERAGAHRHQQRLLLQSAAFGLRRLLRRRLYPFRRVQARHRRRAT